MVQRNRSPRYRAARAAGIAVLFACALALPAGAHRAAAQGALGISPTEVDFGVIGAGGVSVSEITITNGADEARSVDVSVVGDDASWFSVHRTAVGALDDAEEIDLVILEPSGSQTVHVRAAVPDDADPAVSTASVRIVERSEDRTVLLGAEVPVRVTVVGEAEVRGSIVSVDVADVGEDEPVELQVRLANDGTTSFEAVVDALASPIDPDAGAPRSASSDPLVVLPGDEAAVRLSYDEGFTAGDHRLVVELIVGDDSIATATVEVTVAAPELEEPADDDDRSADNRGLILVGSVVLVLVMIGGAVLVARDEAGRHDGLPDDDEETAPRPGEAEGRHTARTAEEAWPNRR